MHENAMLSVTLEVLWKPTLTEKYTRNPGEMSGASLSNSQHPASGSDFCFWQMDLVHLALK